MACQRSSLRRHGNSICQKLKLFLYSSPIPSYQYWLQLALYELVLFKE